MVEFQGETVKHMGTNNGNIERSSLSRMVLSINRMTVHNGPGIRTVIMFKGCHLRCIWCSTPESQGENPEIALYPHKCNACEQCLSICQYQAIEIKDKEIVIDRKLCTNCGKCAEVCFYEAIQVLGKSMSVAQILAEVQKDMLFFKHSKGGVTLSGGEPLLYPDFNEQLLKAFKENDINVGIDTSGYVPWPDIEKVLPYVDFFLWDLKYLDPEKHRAFTGVSNDLILKNIRLVSERKVPIYIRIPLIPGYTLTEENLRATCEFVQNLTSVVAVDLLPLHHLGMARYMSLNRPYAIADIPLIDKDVLVEVKSLVESYGLKCNIID